MKNIFACAAVLLLALPVAALADATPPTQGASALSAPAAGPRDNPAFRAFQEEGGKIEFLGNALGLDGWALIDKDGKIVTAIYATPAGALVKGWLFDAEGRALTPLQIAAYKARVNGSQAALPGAEKGMSSKAENLYAAAEGAGWVRAGNKDAPYLYVFMNVDCDHCQALWRKFEPAVKAGTLQLRLIPFGREEANRNGGAALLSVDNPAEAWKSFMEGQKDALSADKIRKGALDKIDANTKLASQWQLPGVPFTLYKKLTDGVVTAIVGPPDNVLMVQADLMKSD